MKLNNILSNISNTKINQFRMRKKICTGNRLRSHVKSNRIWIVITLFQMIRHQTEFWLVLNILRKCNQNQNLIQCNKSNKSIYYLNPKRALVYRTGQNNTNYKVTDLTETPRIITPLWFSNQTELSFLQKLTHIFLR